MQNCQAINEPTRPLRILKLNTVPKPCEYNGGGFAKAGWNVDELRMAGRANAKGFRFVRISVGAAGQSTWVVIGLVARGGLEKIDKAQGNFKVRN